MQPRVRHNFECCERPDDQGISISSAGAADGTRRQINMSFVLSEAATGTREVLHLFRDVTDRRRVERAAASEPGSGSHKHREAVNNVSVNGFRLPPLTTP